MTQGVSKKPIPQEGGIGPGLAVLICVALAGLAAATTVLVAAWAGWLDTTIMPMAIALVPVAAAAAFLYYRTKVSR